MIPREELEAVCAEVREARSATLAVHEDPDLDAIGSAVGLADLITQTGGQATLRVRTGTQLPSCEWFLDEREVVRGAPPAGEVLFVVDCGSLERMALDLDGWRGRTIVLDHHPDNTRFGDVNLVLPQTSSVSEIVADMAVVLGLHVSPQAATALYSGIAFDSGQFRHASTGAGTFAAASRLVAAGADPTAIYRAVFEDRSLSDLRLWARAVLGAQTLADGRAVVAVLPATEREDAASRTEGIVDSLRSVRGVEVAALVREDPTTGRTRVSLRSTEVDVGALAREHGGGGHAQAAGFTSDDPAREVGAWLSTELAERL